MALCFRKIALNASEKVKSSAHFFLFFAALCTAIRELLGFLLQHSPLDGNVEGRSSVPTPSFKLESEKHIVQKP